MNKTQKTIEQILRSRISAKTFARDKKVSLRTFCITIEKVRVYNVQRALYLILERDKAGLFKIKPTNFSPQPLSKYSYREIQAAVHYDASIEPLIFYRNARKKTRQEDELLTAITKVVHDRWRKPLGLPPLVILKGRIRLFAEPIPGDHENDLIGANSFGAIFLRDATPLYRWVHAAIHEIIHACGFQGSVGLFEEYLGRANAPWTISYDKLISARRKTKGENYDAFTEGLVEQIAIRTFLAIPKNHRTLGAIAEQYRRLLRILANSKEGKHPFIMTPTQLMRDKSDRVVVQSTYILERGLLHSVLSVMAISLRHMKKISPEESFELAFQILVRGYFTGDTAPTTLLFDAYCGGGAFVLFNKISGRDAQDDFVMDYLMNWKRTSKQVRFSLHKNKRQIESVLKEVKK